MSENLEVTNAVTGIVAKGFNYGGAYSQSFGLLGDQTIYADPWNGVDIRTQGTPEQPSLKDYAMRGMDIQAKALSTTSGGVGTAGYAMVPIYVDQMVTDRSRKYTPLVELVRRVSNQGMTADYDVLTAKGGAVTAVQDAALAETNDTWDRASVSMKFLYSVGRVTGPMQASMPSYMLTGFTPTGAGNAPGTVFGSAGAPNAKQMEVLVKARSMQELQENLIINGTISTDATQFDGIVAQQSTTNVVDLANTALEYDDIETAAQYAFDNGGRPTLAVGSSSAVADVRKILIDTYRYSPADMGVGTTLPFGVPSAIRLDTMVGPIPLIPSMYLSNVSGAKQIYFLDMNEIEMRVLQDMTYEDLAHTNDSQKFMLKIYEALVMRAPTFNSFIDNIT